MSKDYTGVECGEAVASDGSGGFVDPVRAGDDGTVRLEGVPGTDPNQRSGQPGSPGLPRSRLPARADGDGEADVEQLDDTVVGTSAGDGDGVDELSGDDQKSVVVVAGQVWLAVPVLVEGPDQTQKFAVLEVRP